MGSFVLIGFFFFFAFEILLRSLGVSSGVILHLSAVCCLLGAPLAAYLSAILVEHWAGDGRRVGSFALIILLLALSLWFESEIFFTSFIFVSQAFVAPDPQNVLTAFFSMAGSLVYVVASTSSILIGGWMIFEIAGQWILETIVGEKGRAEGSRGHGTLVTLRSFRSIGVLILAALSSRLFFDLLIRSFLS